MIGGDKATVRITGQKNPMYTVILPNDLVREMKSQGQELEHLCRIKIWLEKTKLKAKPRKNAFGRDRG